MDDLIRYVRAQLALMAQQSLPEGSRRKPELVLADAGLKSGEIALIIGKNVEAVKKAISRAR